MTDTQLEEIAATANERLLGTSTDIGSFLNMIDADLGVADEIESRLTIERCVCCDSWCDPDDLVDEDGEECYCESCREWPDDD